jgi:hypothetical protein
MTETKLIVFGSFLRDPTAAHDIDMVVPEFSGKQADQGLTITLECYERIARTIGKPVNLFFGTADDGWFNIAGWFDPKVGKWAFCNVFCGRDFFFDCMEMTEAEIIEQRPRLPKPPSLSEMRAPGGGPDLPW